MRRRYGGIFLLFLAVWLAMPVFLVHAEVINMFSVALGLERSGNVHVVETITYDFEGTQRHGIFRDIPTSYTRNGLNYKAAIRLRSVVDEQGVAYPFTTSSSGGMMHVRVGDPDVLVDGVKTYRLSYDVSSAVNWNAERAELYWNATGSSWPVSIEHTSVIVTTPVDALATICFTGSVGSQDQHCAVKADGQTVTVTSDSVLTAGEGLTVAVQVPISAVPEPSRLSRLLKTFRDNIGFGLSVVALLVLFWLWRMYGRDPRGRGTIIAEYEPPKGMTPAMLGYLIDDRIDSRDITASILQLAVKGYLSIHYLGKKGFGLLGRDYELEKKKETDAALSAFERELHEALFDSVSTVKLSALQKTFPQKLAGMKEHLRKEAEDAGYFQKASHHLATACFGIGFLLIVLGIIILGSATSAWGIGILLSGILSILFGTVMHARTPLGVKLTEEIKGFRQFLKVTEKERLKFHNAPAKKPKQFMVLLPFAVALAVEKEWAEQFRSITIEQPSWYSGQQWGTFNAVLFASSMHDFSATAQSQAFTAARSAGAGGSGFGGGFSGGGFGGGGGGSW